MTLEDIALTLQPGIGPRTAAHLLQIFGDARTIYATSLQALEREAGLRHDLAEALVRRSAHAQAEKELRHMERHGIEAIASTDDAYPTLLRECPDYPHVLYLKGDPSVLQRRLLSMVGTRKFTPTYASTVCNRLVEGLAERIPDLCIVSGLAFGIDKECHAAALRCGVPTIAVVACPLPEITPAQHTAFAREIVERGGAIVSELHSATKQNGALFLARNRIIAGLSAGTVIVQSEAEGGSLQTAAMAESYHRSLMAVPGDITRPNARGTNRLIRDQRAVLIESAEDIIRELMWDTDPHIGPKPPRAAAALSEDAQRVLACFPEGEAISIDRIAEKTALDPGTLGELLFELETEGAIGFQPGNRLIKTC